jgi:epoxyqueuosine reductase
MDVCPTQAIVAPYRVDARRCISYLTIEYAGEIPHEFRSAIGNRIYGCDDCQLVCPWNKFAQKSVLPDFALRHGLDDVSLLKLLAWSEADFKTRMAGSAIYRIGHAQWQRNILLALGNAPFTDEIVAAIRPFTRHSDPVLAEQAHWSLAQQIA